ncbi:MAG: hypothetical protein IPH50_12110 [Rhodanobacteraceae bacterium]|nr:hypothetical protein [Rhodanobacteraceae bacterium]
MNCNRRGRRRAHQLREVLALFAESSVLAVIGGKTEEKARYRALMAMTQGEVHGLRAVGCNRRRRL